LQINPNQLEKILLLEAVAVNPSLDLSLLVVICIRVCLRKIHFLMKTIARLSLVVIRYTLAFWHMDMSIK